MIIMVILVAGAIMSYESPVFLTQGNIMAMLLRVSCEAIVAIGMTILLVSGGFDLSVGSTAALAGAVTAGCLVHEVPVALAVLAGLLLGALVGLINGLIIAKVKINPFITTLGMMSIVRGALQVALENGNITGLPGSFTWMGQSCVLGVQWPIIIAAVLVAAGDLLLRKSRFFRQNYYLGGNEKAAILSGIAVDRLKIFNYALTGLLAALAGVVMTARFGSATVGANTGMELQVITAVIIGGASLQGGEGTVLGSFLGSLLMAFIGCSMNLLGVGPNWQLLVIGATLLLAVLIDTLGKRRG